MNCSTVRKILKVSPPTLTRYVSSGIIKVRTLPNGRYDYDEDSVLKCAGLSNDRKCVIYARVSTPNQKKDLENQIKVLRDYANSKGYQVNKVYSDIASGLSYDRGEFIEMLEEVIQYNIKNIFISNRDRFTRVSFDMWKELFKRFCCDIFVANEDVKDENEDKEIFSDIISLLHCFAMRMYSNRRKKKLKLMTEDLDNEGA